MEPMKRSRTIGFAVTAFCLMAMMVAAVSAVDTSGLVKPGGQEQGNVWNIDEGTASNAGSNTPLGQGPGQGQKPGNPGNTTQPGQGPGQGQKPGNPGNTTQPGQGPDRSPAIQETQPSQDRDPVRDRSLAIQETQPSQDKDPVRDRNPAIQEILPLRDRGPATRYITYRRPSRMRRS